MKKIGWLRLLLPIAAIVLCFTLPRFLPDYKNTVWTVERDGQSSALYISDDEELQIYPWEQYHPDECAVLRFTEMEKRLLADFGVALSLLFSGWDDHIRFEGQDLEDMTLYYDQNRGLCFVDEYPYRNSLGQERLFSMVFRISGREAKEGITILYIHSVPKTRQTGGTAQPGDISGRLDKLLAESRVLSAAGALKEPLPTPEVSDPRADTGQKVSDPRDKTQELPDPKTDSSQSDIADPEENTADNPFDSFYDWHHSFVRKVEDSPYNYPAAVVEKLSANGRRYTYVSYQNEVLMISQDQTCILFYDPEYNVISGYSLRS